MLPPSLELLRKVQEVLATIEELRDEATTLDVDQVVAQWRQARSANPR